MKKTTIIALIAITAAAWAIEALAQRCGPGGQCVCGICQIK